MSNESLAIALTNRASWGIPPYIFFGPLHRYPSTIHEPPEILDLHVREAISAGSGLGAHLLFSVFNVSSQDGVFLSITKFYSPVAMLLVLTANLNA